jgi:hypothetical protein
VLGYLTSATLSADDIFILKLTSSGSFAWAKSMGSSNEDQGRSIVIDITGNVVTTGYFDGTVDFDPGVGVSNLTAFGVDDIFISKLDANGNFVWVKKNGGNRRRRLLFCGHRCCWKYLHNWFFSRRSGF